MKRTSDKTAAIDRNTASVRMGGQRISRQKNDVTTAAIAPAVGGVLRFGGTEIERHHEPRPCVGSIWHPIRRDLPVVPALRHRDADAGPVTRRICGDGESWPCFQMEPLTAYRRDGKLVLEIDEARFLSDALRHAPDSLSLVDRERFLEFARANVFSLTHDIDDESHPSWWLRLTQALAKAAASTNHGVRRGEAVAPTCGCDPEEHDGG